MNEKHPIPRSEKPMLVQMLCIGIVGIILFIFTSQLFRAFDSVMPFDASGLTRFARLFVFLAILAGLLIVYINAKKLRYYATKDSVAVVRGAFGSKNKRVYALNNVTGLSMNQSFLGSRFNYGHITLELSMMTKAETIQLTNIENPETVLEKLRVLTKQQ